MAALSALFIALALVCVLHAVLVASIAAALGVRLHAPEGRGAVVLCSAILGCGAVCLLAARVAA